MAQRVNMKKEPLKTLHRRTLEIHGGETIFEKDIHPKLARSVAFPLENCERAARIFAGEEDGFVYSRINNPTVDKLEKRLAVLEMAESALATSSGMSAINLLAQALCSGGGHIVSSNQLYGGVSHLFSDRLPKLGIPVTFVDRPFDRAAWEEAIRPETTFLYVESPSNPLIGVFDIEALARLAHERGKLLVVDSTLGTPVLSKPIRRGADIVVHSLSKYMGNGDVIGGCILGRKEVIDPIRTGWFRDTGPCLSPDNAAILLSNIESLSSRVREHCDNAGAIARFLHDHPRVKRVHYPLFGERVADNMRLMPLGFGGLMAFDIRGSAKEAKRVIERLKLFWLAANIGEARSLVIHPASTTHGQLTDEQMKAAGISPSTIRLSVGREDPDDLIDDLRDALK